MAQNGLAGDFTGRILTNIRDPKAFEDVRGQHAIMYPASKEDVVIAIKLCRETHRDVIIRSGRNTVSTDEVYGEGAVVINLEALSDIQVDGSRVTVGPGVKMEKFAETLYKKGLFLPFRDNLIKSVAAGVLSTESGMLTRSAGLITSYLHEIHVVKEDGTTAIATKNDDLFNAVLAKQDDSIISSLVFDALTKEEAQSFWISFFYLPYRKDTFKKLLSDAFEAGKIPSTVDLSVKVTHAAYGMPVVRVSVAGKDGSTHRETVLGHVEHLVSPDNLGGMGGEIPGTTFTGKEIIKAIVDAGDAGAFSHGYVSTKHTRLVRADRFRAFVDHYCKVVDAADGVAEDGVMYLPNVSMESQVCLTTDTNMSVTAYLFVPPSGMYRHTDEQDKIEEYKRFLKHILPLEVAPSARRLLRPAPVEGITSAGFLDHEDLLISDMFDPSSLGSHFLGDPIKLAQLRPLERIPGFEGDVFMKGDDLYEDKAKQYATWSYAPELMSPYMVTYPVDEKDIQAAIAYGKQQGKRIVARSGGHQYSGMSSGGDETIVLSMDLFKKLDVHGSLATVGVGLLLDEIAASFKGRGITIPHGECPKVGIGGHCQTGGYGHLLRSFGLAIDYMHSFNIVLADGTVKTVRRPAKHTSLHNQNDKIFWGVLGGGPNSFGILTEVTFEVLHDDTHPYSRGLKSKSFFRKDTFFAVMKEVQRWTVELKKEHSDYLPDDLDMMVTAISTDWKIGGVIPMLRSALSLELVYGNKKGSSESEAQVAKVQMVMKDIRKILNPLFFMIDFKEDEHKTLSFMSDAYVRRKETTPEGREFDYPCVKRLNATYHPLTDGFVKDFVDLIDESINSSEVRAVFQMGLGGGQHSGNKNRQLTSCSHRDLAFGLVYDVFYLDGKREVAVAFQSRMKDLLEREFKGEGESVRMLWGSYGETNMNEVWKNYYDSKQVYQKLQDIKEEVDPKDVFHTEFTVQLPQNTGGCSLS